jgi:ankyrin repeat protein
MICCVRSILILSFFLSATAFGATPLESAAASGNLDKVKSLITQGADINAVDENSTWEKTPLYAAAEKGHADVVAYLLEQGADTAIANAAMSTPLRVAANQGHAKVVKLLLAHGADPDKDRDSYGRTPMIWAILAARSGNTTAYIAIIKALHKAGASCSEIFSSPIDDSPISVLESAQIAGDEVADAFKAICQSGIE